MADETVEIKITGDSSDLAAAMADVAERIELLIDALSGTAQKFGEVGKDAEDAMGKVKKATDKAKKSTDQAAKATEEYAKKTKILGMEVGANRKNFEAVSDRLGRVDSSMQALATMSDHLSGSLAKTGKFMAENARVAGDTAAGMEQVILAMTQAPHLFGIVGGLVVAAGVFYHTVQKPFEDVIENNEKLGKSWDQLGKKIAQQGKRIRDYSKQLKLLTGEEKDYDQTRQKSLDTLKASEKTQQRGIDRLFREMKALDKSAEGLKEAERVRALGIKRLEKSVAIEEKQIQQLYEHAKALDEATEAAKNNSDALDKRAMRSDSWNAAMERQLQLGRDVVVNAGDGAEAFNVYVKEMGKYERAADGSAGAMEKVAGMFRISDRMVNIAAGSFINAEKAALRSGTTTEKATKRAKDAVALLNISAKERLGIEEDLLVTAERFGNVYGAVNKSTGEVLNLYQLLNAAMAEAVRRRQAEIAEQERLDAIWEAWVKQRNSVLKSLKDENAAIKANLEGPYRELEQSYESQIEDLDEIIAKYKKNAETNKRTAKLVTAAQEQKALKTREYAIAVAELAERLTKASAAEAALFVEGETALEKMAKVSGGMMFSQHQESLQSLEDTMEAQRKLVEDYYQAAINAGVDEVEAARLRREEMLQIDTKYLQDKAALEDEFRKETFERNLAEAESYGGLLTTMSEATFAAMQAIAEQSTSLNEDQKRRMFHIAQLAAMGEIAINGVIAISKAYAEFGPTPAGIAASIAMGALTATQIAAVASEQPSFDIGGVIKGGVMADTPDQMSINALPGESILNRSATAALGEEGVNALNAGKSIGQEIIVVPAYRHFDRFIKDEYRKGGSFRKMLNSSRQYPVGHRRY